MFNSNLFRANRWRPRLPHPLTFLSGLFIVLSFPPWNLWPLLWVCLIPWLWVIRHADSPRAAFCQGIWLSYFMSVGGFYWVTFAISEFGNIPISLCFIGLQFFCFVGQLQFPVYALLEKKFATPHFSSALGRARTFLISVGFALSYAGCDWILPKIFHDTLGHAFYQARRLRQVADFGGVYYLTFLAVLTNLTLFQLLTELRARRISPRLIWPPLAMLGLILLSSWAYGYRRSQEIAALIALAPRTVQVAAIQANIGDMNKIAAESGVVQAANGVIDTYVSMTEEALTLHPKPEVVIWPETAYPSTFRHPHTSAELRINDRVEFYARQMGVPLLFGGYDEYRDQDYNAFFYLSPRGEVKIYRKNILLLFGEYIPGADLIPWIKRAFPQVGNFGRGVGPEILNIPLPLPSVPIATSPIICYEVLFPYFLIESARAGSQLIINITNDSWFGDWGEPQLHLALATFRSIETRLPLLRSTNTGITALVQPDGEISQATAIGKRQILNVTIPILAPINTVLKDWGDWFGLFALVFGLSGLGGLTALGGLGLTKCNKQAS